MREDEDVPKSNTEMPKTDASETHECNGTEQCCELWFRTTLTAIPLVLQCHTHSVHSSNMER